MAIEKLLVETRVERHSDGTGEVVIKAANLSHCGARDPFTLHCLGRLVQTIGDCAGVTYCADIPPGQTKPIVDCVRIKLLPIECQDLIDTIRHNPPEDIELGKGDFLALTEAGLEGIECLQGYVVTHLIEKHGMNPDDALTYLASVDPQAVSNDEGVEGTETAE